MNDCQVCDHVHRKYCKIGLALEQLCDIGNIKILDVAIKEFNHKLSVYSIDYAGDNLEVIKYINETQPNVIVPIKRVTIGLMEIDKYLHRTRPELYTDEALRRQFYGFRVVDNSIEETMTLLRYFLSKPGMIDVDMDFNAIKNNSYPHEVAEFMIYNFRFDNFMEVLDGVNRESGSYKRYSRFVRGG